MKMHNLFLIVLIFLHCSLFISSVDCETTDLSATTEIVKTCSENEEMRKQRNSENVVDANDNDGENEDDTDDDNDENSREKRKKKGPKVWDRWSKWSQCSVTCGIGKQTRWRHCIAGECAPGEKEAQIKTCIMPPC